MRAMQGMLIGRSGRCQTVEHHVKLPAVRMHSVMTDGSGYRRT
jgi:hypothetical protein